MKECMADISGRCSFDCIDCIYSDIDHFKELYEKKALVKNTSVFN